MIKEIRIQNYKSIVDLTLELGKTNVFIGENGCGKTNILEAMAMLSGTVNSRLTSQYLSNVGVRIAKPSLTKSSFLKTGMNQNKEIGIEGVVEIKTKKTPFSFSLASDKEDNIHSTWNENKVNPKLQVLDKMAPIVSEKTGEINEKSLKEFRALWNEIRVVVPLSEILEKYLIYDLNTPALRGHTPQTFTNPLGINGEGLDLALASFGKREMNKLLKYKYLISWLDEIILDATDELKFNNLRLKGKSQLYFSDKFMKKKSLFNSENANEGVLHILFYLTLFIHKDSPNFFAIDNIETALNPRVCRELMKVITELNKDKQVLITTHNPAILDGLNLMNDDIRLFTVRRNRKGHTVADRIQFKKGAKKDFKLSEMWMKGLLGAVPINF